MPCFQWAFARPFGSLIRLPTSWAAVSASTKMVPKISPKELGGVCRRHLRLGFDLANPVGDALLQAQPAYALLCGVVVSILGVIGDLIESRIKAR